MMMAEPLAPSGLGGALTEHEAMARHVTWRAGGAARYPFRPANRARPLPMLPASTARPPKMPVRTTMKAS